MRANWDWKTDDGPDFLESLEAIEACRQLLSHANAMDLPQGIRDRILEDAGPIEYAANTLHFYDKLIRATQSLRDGQREKASKLLPELKRLADALRTDTKSTRWSSAHAGAENAFDAANAKKAYERILTECKSNMPER